MIPTQTFNLWKIDPAHSVAGFKVRHMMISYVKGHFTGLTGVLKLDNTDFSQSKVEASVPTAGVQTGDSNRDEHMQAAEFLNVAEFPTIDFKSSDIRPTGASSYLVVGDLTILGVTKRVTVTIEDVSEPAGDPWGNQRIGLSGFAKIDRREFGLVWNTALETGGVLVGDEVTITLDVQLIKQ
ncbi:Polyisoprenoid-binding protein YceI [Bryocella elongata]|uniref:Polyisoprenoid-binding protein YceI n=1 Tax=Bryocella elongata TaxID=863522 RepID=A0A1H5UYK9_9BACT|nr:YceI family protein [Bryocella elongata]SEF79541.1 Polyisoprenoid-binding protein YceI [Bryocella elongata]